MNTATITRLNGLNQDFYAEVAPSFSATRQYAWHSWETFFSLSKVVSQPQLKIADVGCGNGRFATWFAQRHPSFSFYGCDSNEHLLAEVQQLLPEAQLEKLDVVTALLEGKFQLPGPFDLTSLFGVFHHIPSFELRQELLRQLADSTKEGGELWLTAWTPQTVFLNRQQVAQEKQILLTELEAGDEFLGWKNSQAVRFVHCLQPQELELLIPTTGWQLEAQWYETERGERGNACFLFRKK